MRLLVNWKQNMIDQSYFAKSLKSRLVRLIGLVVEGGLRFSNIKIGKWSLISSFRIQESRSWHNELVKISMSVAENSVILVGLNIVGTNLYEAIVLRYIPVRLWSTCLRRFILKSPARKTLLVDLETFDNIPSKSDTKSCIERPWRSIDYT